MKNQMLSFEEYTKSHPPLERGGELVLITHRASANETQMFIGLQSDKDELVKDFVEFAGNALNSGDAILAPNGDKWFKKVVQDRDPSPEITSEVNRYVWNKSRTRVRATVQIVKIAADNETTTKEIKKVWVKY